MIYSVWKPGESKYQYYATPTSDADVDTPKTRKIKTQKLGATDTDAAWPLPANAVPIGEGDSPKGMIASLGSEETSSSSLWPLIIVATGLFVVWKYGK